MENEAEIEIQTAVDTGMGVQVKACVGTEVRFGVEGTMQNEMEIEIVSA